MIKYVKYTFYIAFCPYHNIINENENENEKNDGV
jgi:hypothetical protein